MTKWWESCALIGVLLILFVIPMVGGAYMSHASAARDDYELQMRTIIALEAIASAQCLGKPSPQCLRFDQRKLIEQVTGKPPQ